MSGPDPLDFPYISREQDTLRAAARILHSHGQLHAGLMIDRVLARPHDRHYAKPGLAFGHFIDDILRDTSLSLVKKGSAILELVADDMGHLMHARQVEAATAAELRKALWGMVYEAARLANNHRTLYGGGGSDGGDGAEFNEPIDLLPDNLRDLLP